MEDKKRNHEMMIEEKRRGQKMKEGEKEEIKK